MTSARRQARNGSACARGEGAGETPTGPPAMSDLSLLSGAKRTICAPSEYFAFENTDIVFPTAVSAGAIEWTNLSRYDDRRFGRRHEAAAVYLGTGFGGGVAIHGTSTTTFGAGSRVYQWPLGS